MDRPERGASTADAARAAMVEEQIARRGVCTPAVLQAMREVPREAFVDADLRASACDDAPLPIGHGQTISQPYIVAAMAEAAGVRPGSTVLEVGAGSGYAAAVLARLAAQVCAIERVPELAEAARARLRALGVDNVDLRAGDGSLGWPEPRRFDAIIVSAAAPQVPMALQEQLAVGGRLVMPVGDAGGQQLVRLTRTGEHELVREDLEPVRFVPLVGAQGWAPGEA